MSRNPTSSTKKITVGLACLITALVLPGSLALGFATNFGFGRASANVRLQDYCLATPFALCAIGLAATGLFLIVRRHSPLSKKAKALVIIGILMGIIPAIGMTIYLRATTMTATEACQRNLKIILDAQQAWEATNNLTIRTNIGVPGQ